MSYRIFPASNCQPHIEVLLKEFVGDEEFKDESQAINRLEKLHFEGGEIHQCRIVSVVNQ